MKTTIFTRILAATLIPVLLVLLVVMYTARNVIYMDGNAHAKEVVKLSAKHISDQTTLKLENAAYLQENICKEIANVDFQHQDAKNTIDGLLASFLLSNRDLYCAWYVFEPGVFPENDSYYQTVLRIDGEILEISYKNDELLRNPETSPWYHVPFSTGRAYADIYNSRISRFGDDLIPTITITYPLVTSQGRIIGCVGLDIRYEDMFTIANLIIYEAQRIMLTSTEGNVLYSTNESDIGNSLWDYGFQNKAAITQTMREKAPWQEEIASPFSEENVLVCLYPVDIEPTGQSIYLYRDTPVSKIYDSFYSSMEIIVITSMLGMALLAFCVFITTRDISKHVIRITNNFYRVANESAEDTLGGEHIPISETNVIELDRLQSALVSMMSQLRNAHEHIIRAVEAENEKEKLIASAQAKTNFLATMSHEIRTPMNAILGISELMLREGDLTPSQEKYVKDVKISADSLLNIINDILDISKFETGNMELRPDHYNFRALIDNITSLSTRLASDANLQFIYKAEDKLPLCLYGDMTRLRQVLLNLIGNAVKFTREGYVLLRISLNEEEIRFDVEDTGIGIKESEIDTIFETFKQLDTRRNRKVKGTGLGLSISKNLVEQMGGNIAVTSVLGSGSTFSVTLPLVLGDESKLRRGKYSKGTQYSDSLQVLIVDDDEINLSVSSGLLKSVHGINSDLANSGWEAISKVQGKDYDIIFMDHMMPELDGVDTTQHIRQLGEKYREIPIIALTANAVFSTRDDLINGGMNDFLAKPIQNDKLQEILDTWVPAEMRLKVPAEDTGAAHKSEAAKENTLSNRTTKKMLEEAGINTFAGMENVGFDEEVYLQSLRLIRDKLPHIIRLLDDVLQLQNIQEFHIHIHGLKGSLASVGAVELSNAAKELEAAAMEGNINTCRTLLPPLNSKLKRLCQAVSEALLHCEENAGTAALNDEQLEVGLHRLYSALQSFDYAAITAELNAILSMEYDAERREIIAQLRRLIDNFDYPGAITLIQDETMSDDVDAEEKL